MRTYLIIFLACLLVSCKEQPKATEISNDIEDSPLYIEVIDIHDEVMPKMSTIHRLKDELEAHTTDENAEIIGNQIKALNDADEAMMSWMAMFKLPDQPSQQVPYLENEKLKIIQVSHQMNKAILEATATLEGLNNGTE